MGRESLTRAWLAVLAVLALETAALWWSGIAVTFGASGFLLSWCAAVCLVFTVILPSRLEWLKRILVFGNGLVLFSALGLCGGLASYWLAHISTFPYADALLYRADLAMGLDWRAIYGWYGRNLWLAPVLQNCYMAIFYTPLLVMLGLAATGREARVKLFLTAFAIALAVTMVIFPFFPAKTALIHLVGMHPPYVPVTGVSCADLIDKLRADKIHAIDVGRMYGLVTFPSFHAASAVLLSWACWTMRWYRWPIAILNLGMIVATPLEGAHYFIDVLGGIVVAAVSIRAALALQRTEARPSAAVAVGGPVGVLT
jgi:membrane-associated phospholipid phosphatase